MAKLILLVGPPGSGKSTLAKEYEAKGFVRISQDDQGKGGHMDAYREAVRLKQDIIVDRMNFSIEQRKNYMVQVADDKEYEIEIIVLHQPYRVCLERMLKREGHPTIKDEKSARSALKTFFTKYERPYDNPRFKLTFIYPEGDKPLAVICDLDGTLCDVEHRRHHVRRTDGQKKDWRSFFLGMEHDPMITPVAHILEKFQQDNIKIVFCTGRPSDYQNMTEEWLNKQDMKYDALFMRDRHDSRQDDLVKENILDFEILTRFTPYFILDDRDQVVKMWRKRGYMCMQVAEGDF